MRMHIAGITGTASVFCHTVLDSFLFRINSKKSPTTNQKGAKSRRITS